jgi:hypothetical protein
MSFVIGYIVEVSIKSISFALPFEDIIFKREDA